MKELREFPKKLEDKTCYMALSRSIFSRIVLLGGVKKPDQAWQERSSMKRLNNNIVLAKGLP